MDGFIAVIVSLNEAPKFNGCPLDRIALRALCMIPGCCGVLSRPLTVEGYGRVLWLMLKFEELLSITDGSGVGPEGGELNSHNRSPTTIGRAIPPIPSWA